SGALHARLRPARRSAPAGRRGDTRLRRRPAQHGRAARDRSRRRAPRPAHPRAAHDARARRPEPVPAAHRSRGTDRIRARPSSVGVGAHPGALRSPCDAKARRRSRGARRPSARAESPARAGDGRSRQLLAHDVLGGAKAAPRTLSEARVARGPAGGAAYETPGGREGMSRAVEIMRLPAGALPSAGGPLCPRASHCRITRRPRARQEEEKHAPDRRGPGWCHAPSGGVGGNAIPAATASWLLQPGIFGSGGGGNSSLGAGGPGGGAVVILVQGTFTNQGVITADGDRGSGASGGGGGGIIVIASRTRIVNSGTINARGGKSTDVLGAAGSGGGGGGGIVHLLAPVITAGPDPPPAGTPR